MIDDAQQSFSSCTHSFRELFAVVASSMILATMDQKVGRLRRNKPPRAYVSSSGSIKGSGGSFNPSLASGRLLCDTYLSSKEFLRETTYRCTRPLVLCTCDEFYWSMCRS